MIAIVACNLFINNLLSYSIVFENYAINVL